MNDHQLEWFSGLAFGAALILADLEGFFTLVLCGPVLVSICERRSTAWSIEQLGVWLHPFPEFQLGASILRFLGERCEQSRSSRQSDRRMCRWRFGGQPLSPDGSNRDLPGKMEGSDLGYAA